MIFPFILAFTITLKCLPVCIILEQMVSIQTSREVSGVHAPGTVNRLCENVTLESVKIPSIMFVQFSGEIVFP